MAAKSDNEKVQITLRVQPDLHAKLKSVATELDLDMNGLLHQMIRRTYADYALEARVYRQEKNTRAWLPLFDAWRKANPQRKPKEFLDEFRKHVLGEPSDLDTLSVGPRQATERPTA